MHGCAGCGRHVLHRLDEARCASPNPGQDTSSGRLRLLDAQAARFWPPLVGEPHGSFALRAVTAASAIAWPRLSGSGSLAGRDCSPRDCPYFVKPGVSGSSVAAVARASGSRHSERGMPGRRGRRSTRPCLGTVRALVSRLSAAEIRSSEADTRSAVQLALACRGKASARPPVRVWQGSQRHARGCVLRLQGRALTADSACPGWTQAAPSRDDHSGVLGEMLGEHDQP